MEQWKRLVWPFIWTAWSILIVLQIILSFFLYDRAGLSILRHVGWITMAVSAVFGWLPIFTFRKKGGVAKGKSYIQTTVLVDSGIYAVVRHPQYLAGILLSLALILITQHWFIVTIGVVAMVLNYLIALKADQELVEKFGDAYIRYMRTVPRINFVVGIIRLLCNAEGGMNKGIARWSVRTWVLVAAFCLGGLCLAHHALGSLLLPLPSPTPEEPMSPRLTVAVTATAFQTMQAATPTLMPTHTPGATQMPVETIAPITLTIVYDNNAFDARLKTAWGFACLVETGETTILFDTGGDGPVLMDNLAALGFDPRRINAVVLSHIHGDHTGGLDALLSVNDHLAVYVPRSFPAEFKARVGKRAHLIEVSEPMMITNHTRTTGEMGTAIIEQSLIVETDKGLVVITGCAHPGITEIVRQAKAYGDMYLVVGGFHLKDKSIREIETVIVELEQLGVRKIAPCHCTGDQAIRLFREAFGVGWVPAGVGAIISIRE